MFLYKNIIMMEWDVGSAVRKGATWVRDRVGATTLQGPVEAS